MVEQELNFNPVSPVETVSPPPAEKRDPANDDRIWMRQIMNNRPEVLLVVHALVLAGINGATITSEQAHGIPVTHPNVRGAAMKCLRAVGFKKIGFQYGTTKQSHGHALGCWKLEDENRANHFLNAIKNEVKI